MLQRPRLAAYLEQSTRYIAYDAPMPGGGYRYYRDPELGPRYEHAMDAALRRLRDARCRASPRGSTDEFPGDDSPARRRAIQAKALDLLRGLLPAASLSHMGIYASGQTYEQLILHLLAHPLPEARRYGQMILEAVQAVMPSFVTRVERPDRGGEWIAYLRGAASAPPTAGCAGWASTARPSRTARARRCACCTSTATRTRCWPRCSSRPRASARRRRASAWPRSRAPSAPSCCRDLVGERANRRHRPGRGFEALRYRFEIVSDYGAFRDLQRHRMLTVQWQRLTPHLGAGVPDEVEAAGCGDALPPRARRVARPSGSGWPAQGREREALYALCLGYRIRYVLDLNAREAMQLIELRSGREGHPSYRAVAHEMHRLIAQVHPAVAAAMTHVDTEAEPRLERILSEMRTQAKLDALSGR